MTAGPESCKDHLHGWVSALQARQVANKRRGDALWEKEQLRGAEYLRGMDDGLMGRDQRRAH